MYKSPRILSQEFAGSVKNVAGSDSQPIYKGGQLHRFYCTCIDRPIRRFNSRSFVRSFLIPLNRVFLGNLRVAYLVRKKSPPVMEAESLLSCSQELRTGSYLCQSKTLHTHTLFFFQYMHFSIILLYIFWSPKRCLSFMVSDKFLLLSIASLSFA